MPHLLNKLSTFGGFSLREKAWFILLFGLSGIVRAAILILPFRWIMPYLGTPHKNIQLCVVVTQEQLEQAWRIGKITDAATKYTPWKSKCLVQAAVAKVLLNYYKIPYVMYIGMTRNKQLETELELKGHAWLSVGRWIITGGDGHQAFTVASSFVSPYVLENQS